MENKINWDREDYWNELNIYDEYFLSFHYDHCAFDEDRWKDLIEKWKLNIKITKGDSRYDPESEDVTAYNDDYSIVINGMGNDDEGIPGYYLMLTFSKNIDMSTVIKFYTDFNDALDHFDDMIVNQGITGEYIAHPKEIAKIMIDKL